MAYVQPPLNRGPGIYTQEVPSGVHTIAGVSTSVTVFVGRFLQGPVGTAYSVTDFNTFQRVFGGVSNDLPVTWAVQDFFLNGGSQALIVRLYSNSQSPPASGGFASGTVSGLAFSAANPGIWGNSIWVSVAQSDPRGAARYASFGLAPTDLWDLTVYMPNPYGSGLVKVETQPFLSVKPGPRRIDTWLAANSNYVRVAPVSPTTAVTATPASSPPQSPPVSAAQLTGGVDSPALVLTDFTDPQHGYQAVLKNAPLFNILCIPPDSFVPNDALMGDIYQDAATYCSENYAFLVVEPPDAWRSAAVTGAAETIDITLPYAVTGPASEYAGVYFPTPTMSDPTQPTPRPISGMIAGIYARTDASRGVWKAPAGLQAAVMGAVAMSVGLDGADRQALNSDGINCFLAVPDVGVVVWGARTMNGADVIGSDYKYVPIRRFTSYIEQSLVLGTQWAVFEPNADPLWSQLRAMIGSFMQGLFQQGAFAGATQSDAYFVQCDATTTSPTDQLNGVVNVVVGFAPLRPAEFIILYIQQQTASSS